MDLYIQVGVLLLFMSALALFMYIYTAPAEEFAGKVNANNAEVSQKLDNMQNNNLKNFHHERAVDGILIEQLAMDAYNQKITVIVNSKGSTRLYGMYLEYPAGTPNVNFNNQDTKTVQASELMIFGSSTNYKVELSVNQLKIDAYKNGYPVTSRATGVQQNRVRLAVSPPQLTKAEAESAGKTLSLTGKLYTEQVHAIGRKEEYYTSYLKDGLYEASNFDTYLIENSEGVIMGVYAEDVGSNLHDRPLAAYRASLQ